VSHSPLLLRLARLLPAALALLASPIAGAAPAPEPGSVVYVTDQLRLGLYASEAASGRPQRTLISGAKLDVLERSLQTIRVRTEDGDEGWVKTAYLVDEAPAARRIEPLEADNARLTTALETARAERQAAEQARAELATRLDSQSADIARLEELQSENQALEARLDATGVRVSLPWLAAATALALLIGAVAGYLWLDRRVRRQFGGLKLY